MNKTISINLGGRNFFIEEDAFKKLDGYLNGIRQHFAAYHGSGEIVADMESRIAEKFSEKFQNRPQAVITAGDVESLMKELGSVEDIAGEAGVKSEEKIPGNSFAPKRLMRDPDNKIIAGVCSGIAAYFNADPIWIRLIFAILIFAWGAVVPIYFLLWLIMPAAKTPTEKMQMRGEPLNLDSLSETIKERAQEFKQHVTSKSEKRPEVSGSEKITPAPRGSNAFAGFLRQVFQGIGKLIVFLFKLAVRIISLFAIIGTIFSIAGLTIALGFVLFNSHSPYFGMPFTLIPHNAVFFTLLVLVYIIALIPILLVMLLMLSILTGRKAFNVVSGFSLFGVWIAALIIGAILGGTYVPRYVEQVRSSPEFQATVKSYDAKNFSKLDLSNSVSYHLIQGKEFKVEARGWAMDLDRIEVKVENGTLNIDRPFHRTCIFCVSGGVAINITAPDFPSITARNSSFVDGDGIQATSSVISLQNSSRLYLTNFQVKNLTINLQNSSLAELSGISDVLKADLQNSSRLQAGDLNVKTADIKAVNSSRAEVNVSEIFKYNFYNSSRIYYSGQPKLEGDPKHVPLSNSAMMNDNDIEDQFYYQTSPSIPATSTPLTHPISPKSPAPKIIPNKP